MDQRKEITKEQHEIALEKSKWSNRRKMAWLCLISMITITVLILFTAFVPESKLTILSDVITWYYFSCISVIGFYMGVTAWTSRK